MAKKPGEHEIDFGAPTVEFTDCTFSFSGANGYGIHRNPDTSRWYRTTTSIEPCGDSWVHSSSQEEVEGEF